MWGGGYPCVFKIGHAHGGLGKVKVENDEGFEVTSVTFYLQDHHNLKYNNHNNSSCRI